MMDTFEDRMALIEFVILDPAVDLIESVSLLVKWYRYENALRKSLKYHKRAEKLAKPLGEEIEILLFRRNLNDLDNED